MQQENNKKENLFRIVSAILLIIIIVLSAVYFFVYNTKDEGIKITNEYSIIPPDNAYDLLIKNKTDPDYNLTVVDCRVREVWCTCNFDNGLHLPNAELIGDSTTLYNSTGDILVYSINGSVGEQFCMELMGNVFGSVYNLEGGYDNWIAEGYKNYI